MHRSTVPTLVLLVASCARPTPVAVAPPPAPPGEIAVPGDAAIADAAATPDAAIAVAVTPKDLPFVPPAALGPPGSPTPASGSCRSSADSDQDRETGRQAAALDHALRAQALTPLEVIASGGDPRRESGLVTGTHATHFNGRYVLEVGEIAGCGGTVPTVAMTATHQVFVVEAELAAKHARSVVECTNTCRGVCGVFMKPRVAVAIVPADAVLAEPRTIRVPIDTAVTFKFSKRQPCNVP
jgi:hypothetical protein